MCGFRGLEEGCLGKWSCMGEHEWKETCYLEYACLKDPGSEFSKKGPRGERGLVMEFCIHG